AIALHVLDDNFIQPQSGTSAFDHLASGLVPAAVLLTLAAVGDRLRPGLQASLVALAGVFGVVASPGAVSLAHNRRWAGGRRHRPPRAGGRPPPHRRRSLNPVALQEEGRKPDTAFGPSSARRRRGRRDRIPHRHPVLRGAGAHARCPRLRTETPTRRTVRERLVQDG